MEQPRSTSKVWSRKFVVFSIQEKQCKIMGIKLQIRVRPTRIRRVRAWTSRIPEWVLKQKTWCLIPTTIFNHAYLAHLQQGGPYHSHRLDSQTQITTEVSQIYSKGREVQIWKKEVLIMIQNDYRRIGRVSKKLSNVNKRLSRDAPLERPYLLMKFIITPLEEPSNLDS